MTDIQRFPAELRDCKVDLAHPTHCLFSGLFQEEAEIGGKMRNFYTYLTPGLAYDQPCLVIVSPDDRPAPEFIGNGYWEAFAQREKVFLHFLEPEGKWNWDGSDADYMNEVYVRIHSRKYYVTMQDNVYALGFGRGAVVAQQAAMKMTTEWSGLATFGEMDASAMRNANVVMRREPQGRTELVIQGEKAALPVWMFWEKDTQEGLAVRDYWKKHNKAEEERYSNQDADEIYFPSEICRTSTINEEKAAQVRITHGLCGDPTETQLNRVWDFLKRVRRHRCFGSKAMRLFRDPIKYGAALHTMESGGLTRQWYEYVPEKVQKEGKEVPLVIAMHGRGGSAQSFMDLSNMNLVAEERGFIALFPEAGIHSQRPGGVPNVSIWDGSYLGKPIDDTSFLLAMIEDVKKRYPIDAGRIYACGQSSGGMMSSALALRASRVFAAVAPWSAILDPAQEWVLPEKLRPEIPYLFLFGDHDWLCAARENGELEYHAEKNIAEFLRYLMKVYDLNPVPQSYSCGEITYYIYRNSKSTPMLTVGTVKDMGHANYPGESWITYDLFFSRFSRREDGMLLYMGTEAV